MQTEARGTSRAKYTGYLKVYGGGGAEGLDRLFVPSLYPFPKVPVGFEEGHNGAALAPSPMTKTYFLGFFFLERVADFELEGNIEKQISVVEMSRSRELRVDLTEFKGHDLVGLRWWDEAEDDDERDRVPTKKTGRNTL